MTITQLPTEVGGPITKTELRDRLGDPALVVVDVRPLAAYNGWRLRDEARGGHIPGAVAFPIAWLATVDPTEIDRLLTEKGVAAGRDIVVYGDDADDAPALRDRLVRAGVTVVRTLEGGWTAWAAIPNCRSRSWRSTRSSCTSRGCVTSWQGRLPRPHPRASTCCST